ncbi:MAG: hypothetical protein JNK74_18975 [Candidatus Hydrogenedentes bacterium]|nr:hypothetical protein [Candidatus Hydrogenedentota bacterium]
MLKRVFAVGLSSLFAFQALAEDPITYESHIAPIFAQRCAPCHFPDGGKKPKGDFDLTSLALALKGGENGPSIKPGSVEESPLVAMIEWKTEPFMPPKEKFKQLPQEEIDVIKAWITAGAKGAEGVSVPAESEAVAAPMPVIDWTTTPVSALAWSPDGAWVARGGLGTVALYPVKDGKLDPAKVVLLPGHDDQVRALDFSSDGKLLAAAGGKTGRGGQVIVWDTTTHQPLRTISAHKDNILDVAFSPDNSLIATASYDKHVMVFSTADGATRNDFTDHVDAVYALAFSPDGKYLATGAGDRTVKLWDVAEGKRLITFSDAAKNVNAVAFSPDSRYLAAGSADKRIYVWDVPASAEQFTQSSTSTGVLAHSQFAHDGAVLALAYTQDGATLVSSGEDAVVKLWDAATMATARTLEPQSDWPLALALSPAGDFLASGRFDASLALYAVATGDKTFSTGGPVVMAAAEAKSPEQAGRVNVDSVFINATIPPVINSVQPARVVRGGTVDMTVTGKNLAEARAFFTSNLTVEIVSNEAKPVPEFTYNAESTGVQIYDNAVPHELKVKVTIPADTPPGGQWFYVETPLGLAEPMPFTVLDKADEGEKPENGLHTIAALPTVIIGQIKQKGEVDRFQVALEANAEIVFALTDTALTPALRLLDASGAAVADNSAAMGEDRRRLGFRAPVAGNYTLEMSDPELRDKLGYRLHVGAFPYVTDYFPLGVPAGRTTEIQVSGFNLGGATIAVTPAGQGSPWETMPIPLPAVAHNPIPAPKLAVWRGEEVVETEPNNEIAQAPLLAPGTVVNGRVGEDAWDIYRIEAEAGENLLLEIQAERLGVPLDSEIEILDASGEVLQRAVARCTAETHITLFSRDSKGAGLRLDDWSALAMNDYIMASGELLQVRKIPDYADEDVVFSSVGGQRMSLFGTSPQHHAVYAPVYRVELFPPDATFPPNGMPVFPIFWRNDDGFFEGGLSTDARIEFEAPAAGTYFVRVRDALGDSGMHPYRLCVRSAQPGYSIYAGTYRFNVPEGGSYPATVTISRRDGFDAPVKVWLEGLPEGLHANPAMILPDEESVQLRVWADPGAQSVSREGIVLIKSRAETPSGPMDNQAGMGTITVVKAQPDAVVNVDTSVLEIAAGRFGPLAVKLDRFNGFTSRVPIEVLNLPYGVSVMDTGLNGILVRENEFDRSMNIAVEPWVQPMEREIYVQARVEAPSTGAIKFLSQPVTLKILAGAKVASRD